MTLSFFEMFLEALWGSAPAETKNLTSWWEAQIGASEPGEPESSEGCYCKRLGQEQTAEEAGAGLTPPERFVSSSSCHLQKN